MKDFVEAKFKYLATYEEFGWMPYPTVQYLIHENLIRVFFSNATLDDAGEEDEDPCHIMAINTFVIGVLIWVTQSDVATAFNISDRGHSDEHKGFPPSILMPNDNALNLPLDERLLHLFILYFFQPIGLKHTMVRQIDYWFMYHV